MNLNKEELVKKISVLSSLHDETADYINKYGQDPTPNSQASSEFSSFKREPVQTCYSQGYVMIEVSADHMICLHRSLTEPGLTIAPWSSVRQILEASALSCWFLDPDITVEDRVRRSLSFRYEGLAQELKFARAAGLDALKSLARTNDVEQHSQNLGFHKVLDKKGKRIGIGQVFPSISTLVETMLGEEPAYRICSAFVHAHPWALLQGSFKKSENFTNYLSDDTTYVEKHLGLSSIIYLCTQSIVAISRPIWYRSKLFGFPLEELQIIFTKSFDILSIPDSRRFWKI